MVQKKSFLSKIKDGYFKNFNLPRFWSNLKIDKIDNELKKIVDNYLLSESLKFSSKFWNKINISNLSQINYLGIEKFHTTLSRNYFAWSFIDDDFINGLYDFCKDNEIESIDTTVLMKQHESFTITQSINYNLISFLLYQYLKKNGYLNDLKTLEENNFMIENAPILKIDNLKLTQDKLHSLIEYNEIKKITADQNLNYLPYE